MTMLLRKTVLEKLGSTAHRIALCASLTIVAAMATAIPSTPAAADGQRNGSYEWNGNGHGDQGWRHRGYGGANYYYRQQPSYYYAPAPVYYAPPPVYYAPSPVYSPGINVIIPLRIH